MGTTKVKKCALRKKICCTGLTRAVKARQKCLVPARKAQRTNQGRNSFICATKVPICLSFNSQQGPPLYGLSCYNYPPPVLQCIRSKVGTHQSGTLRPRYAVKGRIEQWKPRSGTHRHGIIKENMFLYANKLCAVVDRLYQFFETFSQKELRFWICVAVTWARIG